MCYRIELNLIISYLKVQIKKMLVKYWIGFVLLLRIPALDFKQCLIVKHCLALIIIKKVRALKRLKKLMKL